MSKLNKNGYNRFNVVERLGSTMLKIKKRHDEETVSKILREVAGKLNYREDDLMRLEGSMLVQEDSTGLAEEIIDELEQEYL